MPLLWSSVSPSHSRPVLCLFFIFLVCFIVCFLLQATYFATFRLADSFDRGCFCSCCSYIFKIFRVGEGVFPPSLFCAFSGFFFTSVCLFACAFGLLSLAFVWPNFSSILLHFCPVSPSLFTVFVVFCLLLPAPWLSN